MKRFYWPFLLLGLSLLPSWPTARADGFIIVDERHWLTNPRPPHPPIWPPLPAPRPYAPLEIGYHHVSVKIDGQIATTSVDQEFINPNPTALEGTYLFPIPKGAHLDKFTMEIGGKPVEAELLPAAKAREIYEDIVRKLKDPALLEYADHDVFKVRIFPIEANGRKRINLSYTEILKSDAGLVNYVYPLNTEKFSARPIPEVSIKVELASDQALQSIYSPSHEVEIKRHGSKRATVGFEARNARPDTDFGLYFSTPREDLGLNLITHRVGADDGFFLLLASPAIYGKERKVLPKDVAFVLDTSGSMAGAKMEQAKRALQFCVENLNDDDGFEIIRFSTEVEPLFDHLARADAPHRKQAREFIKQLKPIGGTAISEALKEALALRPGGAREARPFVIIFLTDGKPTIGTTDEDQIVRAVQNENRQATRIFCFGIGTDVNTHLLDRITETTRGFSQYVLPEEDIEVKVSNFFSKIKEPVLANPAIKFKGGIRVSKCYPNPLPDLFRGDQLVLAGRYSGSGDVAITLEGDLGEKVQRFTYEASFPRETAAHEFVPRLWATRRVGYLLDEIRLHGENSELRDEVTELARRYNIVTPYTAYLIVEDEDRRRIPLAQQSLPRLRDDVTARHAAAENWGFFTREKEGASAVAGARYGDVLKQAAAPAAANSAANIEAQRALGLDASSLGGLAAAGAPAAPNARTRLAQFSQQGQFVAGRNFFQNNGQWVDALAQKIPEARHRRIQFNSSEYFAFAARESRALPYLALGQNVQFVLDDTLYEIHE